MSQTIINFFSDFPPQLATMLMGATPVGEIRLSLPVALLVYKMTLFQAFFWSVLGNMIPVTIILAFADKFQQYIQKKSSVVASKWLSTLANAQKKFDTSYEKYGVIGLAIFVGVPLPGTGAWTGALAAFVLALSFKKAWLAILVGVIISGFLTFLITSGVTKII